MLEGHSVTCLLNTAKCNCKPANIFDVLVYRARSQRIQEPSSTILWITPDEYNNLIVYFERTVGTDLDPRAIYEVEGLKLRVRL